MILYIKKNKIVWCFCIAHTAVALSALKRQINRWMDVWTNKETDLFYLSCSRLFPLLERQQRVISGRFFFGSRGERFSESYHSACDIRLRGPPAKHPPETSPASALTRREIIGLPGYCKREVAHFRAFPFLSVSSNHFPHQKVVIMRSHFGDDVISKCVHDSNGAEEIG